MSEIGTNKVFIWKNDMDYLEIGEIQKEIKQNLFTGLQSVDDFNKNVLNQISSYEIDGFKPNFYDLFDIIEV